MDSDPPSVLQLRISLRGVSPPVWRRLLIPEQITIVQLHRVMQLAMGWNDEHLHRFIIRGWRYGGHRDRHSLPESSGNRAQPEKQLHVHHLSWFSC